MQKITVLLVVLFFICVAALADNPGNPNENTVADIDGNVYHTVTIGTQVWMRENLRTAHFSDGTSINEVEDSIAWSNIYNKGQQLPAWCYYEQKVANNALYGKLYNWFVVKDTRNVCPAGWHVPKDDEWVKLTKYMGGESVAGGAMKSLQYWNQPNNRASDTYGFNGLPGGIKYGIYDFYNKGNYGYFWTSTEYDSGSAWFRNLCNQFPNAGRNYGFKVSGMSVRCVKNLKQ